MDGNVETILIIVVVVVIISIIVIVIIITIIIVTTTITTARGPRSKAERSLPAWTARETGWCPQSSCRGISGVGRAPRRRAWGRSSWLCWARWPRRTGRRTQSLGRSASRRTGLDFKDYRNINYCSCLHSFQSEFQYQIPLTSFHEVAVLAGVGEYTVHGIVVKSAIFSKEGFLGSGGAVVELVGCLDPVVHQEPQDVRGQVHREDNEVRPVVTVKQVDAQSWIVHGLALHPEQAFQSTSWLYLFIHWIIN